jgi:hypothetical protein
LTYNSTGVAVPYWDFLWTPEIEAHLAEHGVSAYEFEEVVCNPEVEERSRRSGLPLVIGETASGKYLACVYRVLEDGVTVLPVTAYEIGDDA